MKYYYITNDSEVAKICDENNIIPWVDLEVLGKEERQKGMNTVKSNHSISDIYEIKKVLKNTEVLVRINPINGKSKEEIDNVINAGADIIMLPMFKSGNEVKKFVDYVDKRCKTMLLFETKESVKLIDEIMKIDNIDIVHIGLNDLHLSYGLKFMFEPLVNGIVEQMCQVFFNYNKPYGIGGIAKLGRGDLPAEYVINEHVRLKSSAAILSRSFCDRTQYSSLKEFKKDFESELSKVKDFYAGISQSGTYYRNETHNTAMSIINKIIIERENNV